MLSKAEARRIASVALDIIQEMEGNASLQLVLFDDKVIESPLAWVFPFNTWEYASTGDVRAMAIGVGPIVVNRQTGRPFVAPPMPIANLLAQYADNHGEGHNWF